MDSSTNGHGTSNGHAPKRQSSSEYDPDTVPEGFRFTAWRALGMFGFLLMALFWIWAFNNRDSVAHPDTFDDPTFTVAAEAICAETQATINSFPLPTAAENPVERGLLIEQGTAELEQMVAELRALDPPSNEEGLFKVPLWLEDWDLYISDRIAYSTILATGEDPPVLLSANPGGARVTDALRTFAEVNTMASCSPSGDV